MPKKPNLKPINEILACASGSKVSFVGKVSEKPKKGISKKKNPYLKLQVSDEVGSIKCMVFNDKLTQCESLNGGKLPAEGDVVIVTGQKMDGDTVFADQIAVQLNRIYDKLASIGDKGEKSEELALI